VFGVALPLVSAALIVLYLRRQRLL
jgi:hypothetical protein